MVVQHLKQAWRLIRQHRLYSIIYIVGTAIATLMAMLVAFYLHLHRGSIYPEYQRDRCLYIDHLSMEREEGAGNKTMSSSALSPLFIEQYLRPIEGVEMTSIEHFSSGKKVHAPSAPKSTPMAVRYVDDLFWRLYDYEFVSGKPFDAQDVSSSRAVAVVSQSVARHLFADGDAVGNICTIAKQDYRIVGVVADVPYVQPNSFSHIWVPYTTLARESEREEGIPDLLGNYKATILVRKGYTADDIRQSLALRLQDYTHSTQWEVDLENAPYTPLDLVFGGGQDTRHAIIISIVLIILFLAIPALNLSGLNSTILESRLSEIGVRKVFGATNANLLMQFIAENLLLSFIGASLGFVSALFVSSALETMYIPELFFGLSIVDLQRLSSGISPTSMLDGWTLLYLLVGAFVINLFSSLIPVWIFSRRGIVSALMDNQTNKN